jgi:hypothetical protein
MAREEERECVSGLRIGEEVVVDFGERYKTVMKTWRKLFEGVQASLVMGDLARFLILTRMQGNPAAKCRRKGGGIRGEQLEPVDKKRQILILGLVCKRLSLGVNCMLSRGLKG